MVVTTSSAFSSSHVLPGLGALAASALIVWWLSALDHSGHRAVSSRAQDPASVDWPTLNEGEIREQDLLTVTNQQRGAVRFVGEGVGQGMRLMVVIQLGERPTIVPFEPGFVGDRIVEFYGIDTGQRSLYIERDGNSSPLLTAQIKPHEITTLKLPELRPQASRKLVVEGSGTDGASILLEYLGFEVLHRWQGEPLVLRSPLTKPTQVSVSTRGAGAGPQRMGVAVPVTAENDLRIELPADSGSAILLSGSGPAEASYGIELSAGRDVIVESSRPTTKNLLAVLRPDEFSTPPRVHTWVTQPINSEIEIAGAPSGEAWVGVGLERLARYVLWRKHESGQLTVARTVPAHTAGFTGGRVRLPLWMRILGRERPTEDGARKEHDFGVGQVWDGVKEPGIRWDRLVAWVDAIGGRYPVQAEAVDFPPPPEFLDGDTLSIVIRAPHALRGSGLRFMFEQDGSSPISMPPIPDGLIDASVRRQGREVAQLHSVIADGQFLGRASAWTDSRTLNEDQRYLDLEVVAADGKGVVGALVFSEAGGDPIGTTDEKARFRFERGSPSRLPTLVSVRKPGQFTTTQYVAGSTAKIVCRTSRGSDLNWSRLQRLAGLEFDSLGLGSARLSRQPDGSSIVLAPDSNVVIAPTDVIEFVGGPTGREIWGWFQGSSVKGGAGSGALAVAEVVLVNHAADRTVHLSLPRSEIRLGLGRNRLQRLSVHAPTRLSITSVVSSGRNGERVLVDEGVAVEVKGGDVLVVTYH